jgi:N-acetylglucosaminyldiphosphoundecaprenol N-acetyl-beta-D-mannosaminyltransferase
MAKPEAGIETVPLGALSVHRIHRAQVLDAVFAALAAGRGGRLLTPNLEFLQRADEDAEIAALFEASDLRIADGMPLLWLARISGRPLPERIAGADLVWDIAERAAREGRTLFLLGGNPGVAERAAEVLRTRWPGLVITGCAAPQLASPPSEHELAPLREALRACQPALVFCAFGAPKQEQVAAALAPALPRTWWIGCGYSLSFIAGDSPRAPRWMQRAGLEWLHRLAHDPGRLAPRYLARNLPFLGRSILRELRQRRGAASAPRSAARGE